MQRVRDLRSRFAAMEIGELVTYEGKSYVLRGLDPMSVPDRSAQIEDPGTGELLSVAVASLTPAGRSDEV